MQISEISLWTVDRGSLDRFVGGTPADSSRPQNETFCVEIKTESGERGVAANRGGGRAACYLIEEYLAPILLGSDPARIGALWKRMYDALPTARGGLTYMAISGLDLALWDLKGKLAGMPVYDLLGGKHREELPAYITVVPEVMDNFTDAGFMGVKLPTESVPSDGRAGLDAVEELVADAREAFGWSAEVMIDCFMDWDMEYTVRAADRLAEYELKWIEDPLPAGDTVEQYRSIRSELTPVQVAVGNVEFGHRSFHELINEGAADIVQPDIHWIGGMTEMRRIGAIAKPLGLPLIPHRGNVYACHYALANADSPYVEYMLGTGREVQPVSPAIDGEPVPEDGAITVPEDPGFGVDLNTDVLEAFAGMG